MISTDDAGVLRTDLTQQYVLLALRYPEISYQSIKRFVSNGLTYSFADSSTKAELLRRLEEAFATFEHGVIEEMGR